MFGRLRRWGRRHGVVLDVVWVLPLWFGLAAATGVLVLAGESRAPAVALVGLALACLPLVWRRRYPVWTFVLITMATGLVFVDVAAFSPLVSQFVALFAVAKYRRWPWAVGATAVAVGRAVPQLFLLGAPWLAEMLLNTAVCLLVLLGGLYANMRRAYYDSLEERAERLESERDQQARIAVAEERSRIARELHDVVAHNVSVMVVQADGAGYMIDSAPERAKQAVETIAATGRQALVEMRRLLGVLRDSDAAVVLAPQPGLDQLDELLEQFRAAGLPVESGSTGRPVPIPQGRQIVVYRVVQEALTNTLKHGGPGAHALVRLEYGDGAVRVRVVDDGMGAAAAADGRGHGLIGMRERVAVYGGELRTGPLPGGGFEVCATLPLAEAPG
ncbi:sensor histidine kinase [Allonocardiopsis opalescens]|uniref:histidine kinase n=1 Tax=Allonocardiopsis opalescens TaxID=1144618 RepID=A0A2T0Q216_9ACTN|nr:histidine kinase [Allonocardiopsis opalescens]PRX97837.1 signal transduction histidine kinase [Allonocardiopsis opalescens]